MDNRNRPVDTAWLQWVPYKVCSSIIQEGLGNDMNAKSKHFDLAYIDVQKAEKYTDG